MDFTILQQLGVALALASLIGLEREHKNQLKGITNFGGVRTFALIGLMGALAYYFADFSINLFITLTGGFLALVVAAYVLSSKKHDDIGSTSEFAAILVYIIGVLSAMEQYFIATIVALVVLLILHFKDPLHEWAKHLQSREIVSTIQFLIITFVILPLLPNEYYGPYDFFNPYILWLMVVFISGISFVSYFAMKILGAGRGIVVSGFLAGFISSTALAFSFSGESKKNKQIIDPYVLAVVVASTAMFFRVLIEVFVLNRELFMKLILPMLVMGALGVAAAVFLWVKKMRIPNVVENKVLNLKSPFSIWPALKFALFFGVILFLTEMASHEMGEKGVYLTSLFSGFFDIDAITVSMSNLAKSDLSSDVATKAITIAAMANTFTKGAIFLFFGNKAVAFRIITVFGLILAGGAVTLIFI